MMERIENRESVRWMKKCKEMHFLDQKKTKGFDFQETVFRLRPKRPEKARVAAVSSGRLPCKASAQALGMPALQQLHAVTVCPDIHSISIQVTQSCRSIINLNVN